MIGFDSYNNWLNESIKHLAGRTEDELVPLYNHLTPDEKVLEGIRKNMFKLFMLGLKEGAKNIHGDDDAYLRLACHRNRPEMVKVLLEKGADPNASYSHTLQLAAAVGATEIVRMLLDAGADPNAVIVTNTKKIRCLPLKRAAEEGHTEIVKMLLDAGSKIDPIMKTLSEFDKYNEDIQDLLKPYIK